MSNKNDLKEKILSDLDFIYSPKYKNSLKEFINRHDNGVENKHAAKVLLMEEEEVDRIFQEAVINLKEMLEADDE